MFLAVRPPVKCCAGLLTGAPAEGLPLDDLRCYARLQAAEPSRIPAPERASGPAGPWDPQAPGSSRRPALGGRQARQRRELEPRIQS